MYLRQIHMEDMFGPLLGRVEKSKIKVKKRHFSALSATACGLFGKISLAFSFCLNF